MRIVELREGRPPLSDIAGRLRLLANEIESGVVVDVESIFVILPQLHDYPHIYQFGATDGENHPIIQFELAKQKFILFNMQRR